LYNIDKSFVIKEANSDCIFKDFKTHMYYVKYKEKSFCCFCYYLCLNKTIELKHSKLNLICENYYSYENKNIQTN